MKKFLAAGLVAASLAVPTAPVLAQATDAGGGGTTMQDQSAPKKSMHKKKIKKTSHKKMHENKSM